MKYYVVGRGGLHDILLEILGKDAYKGFYDDRKSDSIWQKGSFADSITDLRGDSDFFLGFASIANMPYRGYLSNLLYQNGNLQFNCVHPRAIVSSCSFLDGGGIICGGAHIGVNVRLGQSVIVFSNSTIEHDSILGDNVNIAPGVTISGGVTIEENVFIGAGSTLIDGINIGKGTIIAAGSTVVSDLETNSMYSGCPARKVRNNDLYRYDYPSF